MNTTGPEAARRWMTNSFSWMGAKNGSSTWLTPAWPRTVPRGMFVYSTSSDK